MSNGEDIFFHKSGVEKHPTEVDHYGYQKLAFRVDEGVEVTFDVTEGQKGPMAVDVKFAGDPADMESGPSQEEIEEATDEE
jgi:cold shock CspA family protein